MAHALRSENFWLCCLIRRAVLLLWSQLKQRAAAGAADNSSWLLNTMVSALLNCCSKCSACIARSPHRCLFDGQKIRTASALARSLVAAPLLLIAFGARQRAHLMRRQTQSVRARAPRNGTTHCGTVLTRADHSLANRIGCRLRAF